MSIIYINPYFFPSTATDPNFASVSLLLHGDGTNGSTTITDSSSSPKTVTANGNAQISTAQSKFSGGSSILFDGSGDYLSTPDTSSLDLSTGDFTIEMWTRPVTSLLFNAGFIVKRQNSGQFGPLAIYRVGSSVSVFVSSTNSSWNIASNVTLGTLVLDTWHHIGLVRSGSQFIGFFDGTVTTVATSSNTLASNALAWLIGAGDIAADSFNGYIEEVRITKGVARYTANFTPPIAPFPDA